MDIVLLSINAKYIHTNNAVRLLKANNDFDITILEYNIKDKINTILNDIRKHNPDIIACSVYIWNVEIFRTINNNYSDDAIWILGGPEVSYDANYFLSNWNVDYIVKGEGEVAFNQLLHALNNHIDLEDVPNISYKTTHTIHHPITTIPNLTSLHSPHYYEEDIPHIKHKISYIESSRGCPFHCSYCLSSLEKGVRFFPLKRTLKAIDYLIENGSKTIKFLDRTFNANKHTMAILKHIIKQDNSKITVQFEITGDILDETIIDYIHNNARKGLFRFEIGIQSIHDNVNFLVDRKQNTTKLFHIIKKIKEEQIIDLHLDLIAGLPLETITMFEKTFNQVFKLGAKELQLGFLKMLRGTKIRIQAEEYGYTFEKNAPYEIIKNNDLSKTDIAIIHNVETMLDLYHNKEFFGQHMKDYLMSLPSVFQCFKDLASFYEKNNYSTKTYQIDDIYTYFFDFINNPLQEYYILQDYLSRFPIKPKIFWKHNYSKQDRHKILNTVSNNHNIPLHMLFKHSVLLLYDNMYTLAYYQNNECNLFYEKR